jgi:hypothetical protein
MIMNKLLLTLTILVIAAFAQEGGLVNGSRGFPVPNDASTGTTKFHTAMIDTSGKAINAGTSNTKVKTYIVTGAAGIVGNADLAGTGAIAPCIMDSTIASLARTFYVINVQVTPSNSATAQPISCSVIFAP